MQASAASPLDYGALTAPHAEQRKLFLRFQRRRMNAAAIMLNLFVPWFLFCTTYAASALSIRYESPGMYALIVGCTFLAMLVPCGIAVKLRQNLHADSEREPAWHIFLALCMIIAWFGGFSLGDVNYRLYTRPYCDMMNLNTYTELSTAMRRGQQIMDAGTVQFATGTRLDINKSMGFKSKTLYCVAPITIGNASLPTYDFWAVGTDCCSGGKANFHCPDWNQRKAIGGLRLLSDDTRPFYRLAVQQAETAYGIKAAHPLFFTWVKDPMQLVEGWRHGAQQACLCWIFAHLLVQAFFVLAASIVFARIRNL